MLKVQIFAKKAKRFPVVISQFANEDGGNVNRISKHAHEPRSKDQVGQHAPAEIGGAVEFDREVAAGTDSQVCTIVNLGGTVKKSSCSRGNPDDT
jgi:hypothetical protein